jgi:cobalt-zinc-cadmium efflux system outer membrane protein
MKHASFMKRRPFMAATFGSVSIAALVVSGCASSTKSSQPGGVFNDVRATLADRGVPRVEWNTGSADDARATDAVRTLLAREMTADNAVQVALLNNRRLQATFEDLGIAQADLVQAGLLSNPVFSLDLKFAEAGGGTMVEMAVAQEFLEILQLPMRKRLAGYALAAAKVRVGGAVLDLAGETRRAFFVHQAAVQTLDMRRQVAEATGVSAEFARRLREAGNITILQRAREQALDEQARVDLVTAEAHVLATRERLNALMGLWGADTQWTVASRLPDVPAKEVDTDSIEPRAVERSLELAESRAAVEAAAEALGIRKSYAIFGGGDVELGAAAEREAEGGWTVGPAVSVPIPLFDTGGAAVSRASAELRRARQNYTATAIEVRAAARAALNRVVATRATAERYRATLIPLRHVIVEQTQAENNAMLVGAFDVLRAKQDEIEAGAAYVTALRDYWIARTDFDQVMNGRMAGASSAPMSPSAGRATAMGTDNRAH